MWMHKIHIQVRYSKNVLLKLQLRVGVGIYLLYRLMFIFWFTEIAQYQMSVFFFFIVADVNYKFCYFCAIANILIASILFILPNLHYSLTPSQIKRQPNDNTHMTWMRCYISYSELCNKAVIKGCCHMKLQVRPGM